jgi:glycogen debranching enzyme
VEVNALWYSSLKFAALAESKVGEEFQGVAYDELASLVKKSFNERFWNPSENALFDVIDGDQHRGAIRPNMIFAVSHGEDLLSLERQISVFYSVTKDLLAPFGLRSLSPRDSHYRGRYETEKPPAEKDLAYHQGTVWPWLLGGYADALVRVRQYEGKSLEEIKAEILALLSPLIEFFLTNPDKSLPEVFDGDPPYRPGGTRSQAWSVAEIFRVAEKYLNWS